VRNNLSRTVRYGLPEDYMETYADKVKALPRLDITAAAKKVVHPDNLVWVVVGDRSLGYGEVKVIDTEGNPVE